MKIVMNIFSKFFYVYKHVRIYILCCIRVAIMSLHEHIKYKIVQHNQISFPLYLEPNWYYFVVKTDEISYMVNHGDMTLVPLLSAY